MGANMSHTRKLRKSMPDKLNVPEKQGNVSPPSQGSTSLVSTPISTRRNRKSRGTGHTSSRVAKSSENDMDYSTPITAAPRAIATQSNVLTTSSTPDKLTQPETPSSSTTRSRRRERKPTAAITTGHTDQTASTPSTSTKGNEYDQFILTEKKEERHPRMTNTVTLALGRKSLETIINEPPDHISYEHDIAKSEEPTPIHVYGEDNYHFDYDTDMYRNNFGLDGHMDTPASPTSFSTTTSVAARTSGRTRKPTIRALESFESEQRFRRARATSTKPGSSNADAATGRKTRSKSKASQNPMTSVPGPAKAPDMNAIAKQLFDLVAAAMADDFEPAPEAETWLNEKRQEFNAKTTPKTTESPQPAAGVVPDGETTTTSKKQSLSDSVQASQPWTDKDGWTYTGQINEFGEEYVLVPSDFEWYRPNNTYGDKDLPQPPLRLISKDQLEKDRVFGFPPRIGERNLPRDIQAPFMYENIDEEKAKIKAREAARQRGISVHRFMPLAEIEALISHHDNAGYPSTTDSPAVEKGSKEPSRKRRRTEAAATASSSHKPKRRRRETTTAAPGASSAPGSPAPEKPKTLKITLTFSNREVAAGTSTASVEAEPPRKRSRSEFEEGALESSKASLPKARKLAASASQSQKLLAPTPSTPQTATTGITNGHQDTTSSGGPGASEQLPAETPGGRPRRRAAAALIAGFQNHADERARRANARKKTASLGPAVESPLRHAVNPMNLD